MRSLSLLLLHLVVTLAEAASYKDSPFKVKESIVAPPRVWVEHAPAPSNHILELRIALPQPFSPLLEKHLLEVSDPSHKRYGDYLSKQETESFLSPHPHTIDSISEWLASYGIHDDDLHSSAQGWVTVRVPVGLAEEMLDAKYHVYRHSETGEYIVRTTSYSLPEVLHDHVQFIQPTTMFARFRAFSSTLHWTTAPVNDASTSSTITGPAGNQVDASCNQTITPTCLRQLYNAVGYETSATNGNQIGITSYLGLYVNDHDLQQFFEAYVPAASGSNYTTVSINGGQNNQSIAAAGLEADLDSQYAFGLTYPTPRTLYTTAGSPPFDPDLHVPNNTNEPYSYWLEYMLSAENLPQTISTSYGDDEQTVPESYANRVCMGFAALGARGVSLTFSSGDYGVGDGDPNPETQLCFSNDGRNTTMFIPSFPASCPFVTTVGGTIYIPETAASFSGGGFSNYFPRPSYQDRAVSDYLSKLAPGTYEGLYNPDGRAYPDVSAQSDWFMVAYQGQFGYVGGTSASTPTFASIISMVNDARINAGKKGLGFLNPWLYSVGYAGLNDITTGHNPGCGTEGFNASIGWDPVTGFGTPNLEELKDLALQLP
ncbi:peptidase S8/S53 domain-containing protein [Pisolithus microcarpus]|nr:peptidase S8/S53 domain-containing protein [Pisolithus microcarpus]